MDIVYLKCCPKCGEEFITVEQTRNTIEVIVIQVCKCGFTYHWENGTQFSPSEKLEEGKEKLYVWKRKEQSNNKYMVLHDIGIEASCDHGYTWAGDGVYYMTKGTRQQWEEWCDEFYLDKSRLDECLVEVQDANENSTKEVE